MGFANVETRYTFTVVNLGTPVTGLTTGSFTISLKRLSGASLVAASETVTVTELGGGEYKVAYTPTQVGLYRLSVEHASYSVYESVWSEEVYAGLSSSSGPWLSTRDNVKLALGITKTDDDARIDELLANVTEEVTRRCNRESFFQATVTHYPVILGRPLRRFRVPRPPIASIASLWFSTAVPRVYGASELQVEGTDFFVADSDTGWITLVSARSIEEPVENIVKVTYTGGYSTIPKDLERAAIETVQAKLDKGKARIYHLTNESRADGSISGIRFDDVPDDAARVFERYVLEPLGGVWL